MNLISDLRKKMQSMQIDALIIPSNDPHFSEYPADHWKLRKMISGFDGSAGILVVTGDKAVLRVDSRYYIQAEIQLKGSGVEVKKQLVGGGEQIDPDWFKENLAENSVIGLDSRLFTPHRYNLLKKTVANCKLIDTNDSGIDIWPQRPALPDAPAFLLPDSVTGKSRRDKIDELVRKTGSEGSLYPVGALDEIAWLLNMRGSDVKYNPVVISWLIIDYPEVRLFIDPNKLNPADKASLESDNVVIYDYHDYYDFLKTASPGRSVIIDSGKINMFSYKLLSESGAIIVEEEDKSGTIASMKAVKNQTEADGFRQCMIDDGTAMVRFIKWLCENAETGKITEIGASDKLDMLRASSRNFKGLSFKTISAFGAHGAMPHYSATEETDTVLSADSFFLIDSGGQYLTGTTDITRTFRLGEPTPEEKIDYTLVLKGMLNLSAAKFPSGTRGSQIDILARRHLWKHGKNYLHGTGHGVGHFLNVHEGPQSIRMEENPVTLKPGMVVSDEPAVYLEGKYGIRIENMMICVDESAGEFGQFLSFETLTLCPIETKALDMSLMTDEEIDCLNDYHKTVFDKLSPYLNVEEKKFLEKLTLPLKRT